MKKTNWSAVSKSAKDVKKSVKNTQQLYEFFKEFPEEGYMRDNISKKVVVIKDCKSSTLRRYVKLLDNFYYLLSKESDKKMLLDKKVEVEKELNTREDGLIEKKEE